VITAMAQSGSIEQADIGEETLAAVSNEEL
jgi:hypothetical protein